MLEKCIDVNFQGCISIKKDNKQIFDKAFGYANLSNQVPNEIDTRFATASAGKVFVAVGILQLIEKGLLHFDDKLGDLIDRDWHEIDTNITVKQLLTHTSGIPDYFDEMTMTDYADLWVNYPNYKIRTSSDLIPLFIDKPMMFQRGAKFQYNNTGFVVLGLIIEAVTKMKFDAYLKANVFDKCDMHLTGYYELDRLPAKCANNYIYDEIRKEFYTNIYSVDVKGTGAGGAFTTIGDVENFWRALLNYELLSKEMTEQMLSVQAVCSDDEYYGYGIWLGKDLSDNVIPYFTGCDPGVSFISTYNISQNVCITIVSNFGNDVWKMLDEISTKFYTTEL